MLQILENARVYSPAPLGVGHVVVAGERVFWIGTDLPAIPDELIDSTTDLEGARVLPGLIDCHVHLTGGGGESGAASRVPPLALSQFTRAGTTSVIGVLGTDDLTRSTASLVATARALTEQGLSAWCMTGGYHLPPMTLTGSLRGDIVHIDRIIAIGELAISDHRSSQPTLDEFLRVASEAHVAGLMTGKAGLLHLHLGDGDRGLDLVRKSLETSELPSRVFHPTHVNRQESLFQEALELARAGCNIDVTAFPIEGEDELSASHAVEAFLESDLPTERLTVSSDAGGSLPVFDETGRVARMDVGQPAALRATLGDLVEAGHPLETVLPMVTSNVADLFRLPGKGRIATGFDADLIVLDDEGGITDVMARGKWHVRRGDLAIQGTFEQE